MTTAQVEIAGIEINLKIQKRHPTHSETQVHFPAGTNNLRYDAILIVIVESRALGNPQKITAISSHSPA
jgi:hypothetical protein